MHLPTNEHTFVFKKNQPFWQKNLEPFNSTI